MGAEKNATEQIQPNQSIFGPVLSTLFALGGAILVDFEADSVRIYTHLLLHSGWGENGAATILFIAFLPISIACLWYFAAGIERNFGSRYARIGLIGALLISEFFHPIGNACDLLLGPP